VRLEKTKNAFSGDDVLALTGLQSGPSVGKVLAELNEAVSLGLVKNRDEALLWLSSKKLTCA
jgi:hypothetical protein